MSFLVRKIERNIWSRSKSDVEGSTVMADVVAHCVRPGHSELSTWFAETEDDISIAQLGLLAGTDKLCGIHLVVLSLEEVAAAGLEVVLNPATKGPLSLRSRHRDIAHLDLDKLKVAAQLVQRHVIAGRERVLSRLDCKKLLKQALAEERFGANELDPKLVAALG